MSEYTLLEPNSAKNFGSNSLSFNTSQPPSFFTSTSFIYSLAFTIILVTASFRYAYAGTLRMGASEEGIRKSKEEFKRVTYGLLGVLGLWLVLFTVNKDMLTGNVSLENLKTNPVKDIGGSGGSITPINENPSGTSASCENPESIKNALKSGSGICGNTSCSLSGCLNNNQYKSLVQEIAGNDWKIALILLCKESSGNPKAKNNNPNGTFDCGLMQVNQATDCDAAILDPRTNITRGVAKLREKLNTSSNQAIYPDLKVNAQIGAVTAYNCCANGTIPNQQSSSCSQSDGWPSIPKWACPIDPGTGKFNMCGVKSYACDINACLNQL